MDAAICQICGSNEFLEKDEAIICAYCRTLYSKTRKDNVKDSSIALNDDVQILLKKCRQDPGNAKRYATLALEIDPSNLEAASYL